MKVYLSGAIEQATNDGAEWRNEIARFLITEIGHEPVDPVKLSDKLIKAENASAFRSWKLTDIERFKSFMRKIIDQDVAAVIRSDYMICLWNRAVEKGGGTQGEITVAWMNNVPVYLVYDGDLENLSSWIIGCTTEIFPDFSHLRKFLSTKYGSKNART